MFVLGISDGENMLRLMDAALCSFCERMLFGDDSSVSCILVYSCDLSYKLLLVTLHFFHILRDVLHDLWCTSWFTENVIV